MLDHARLLQNAERYAKHNGIVLERKQTVGHGSDGAVWKTSQTTVVKALFNKKNYDDELRCYRRLRDAGIEELCGFAVPFLQGYADPLQVIEMTYVEPPFLLDFGKVYLDGRHQDYYDAQQMEIAVAEWRERFDDRWPKVANVLEALKRYGIYYVDPRPGNIVFGDEDERPL